MISRTRTVWPGRSVVSAGRSNPTCTDPLRASTCGDTAALHTQITALRAERAQLLDTYRGFEKRQFPDPSALNGSALHQYLVLRGGIRAEESTIDWLDEVTAALQEGS